jgi:hypothetical protein
MYLKASSFACKYRRYLSRLIFKSILYDIQKQPSTVSEPLLSLTASRFDHKLLFFFSLLICVNSQASGLYFVQVCCYCRIQDTVSRNNNDTVHAERALFSVRLSHANSQR